MKNKHGIKEMVSRYLVGLREDRHRAGTREGDDEVKKELLRNIRYARYSNDRGQVSPESAQASQNFRAFLGQHRKTKVRSGRHAHQSDVKITKTEGSVVEELDADQYKRLPRESKRDYLDRVAQYHRDTTKATDINSGDEGADPDETITQRDERRQRKKATKKNKPPQKDWTEYEGPSLSEQADYIDWFLEEGKRWEKVKGAVKKIFKRKPKDTRTPDQIERDQARDAAFAEDPTGKAWEEHGMSKLSADAKTARSHQIKGERGGRPATGTPKKRIPYHESPFGSKGNQVAASRRFLNKKDNR